MNDDGLSQVTTGTVSFRVAYSETGLQIEGEVIGDEGTPIAFDGWLGLASAIEVLASPLAEVPAVG